MNRFNWKQAATLGLAVLLALLIGASWRGGYGGWGMWPGMMGPGMMGRGMMGGLGFAPLGWIFMLLVPLGLLALMVLGVAWLIRQVNGSTAAAAGPSQTRTGRTCPNCDHALQTDWRLCPYCGQSLSQISGESSASPAEPLHA